MALQTALQGVAPSQCEEDNAGFGLLRKMIGSFGRFEVGEGFFLAPGPRICQGPKGLCQGFCGVEDSRDEGTGRKRTSTRRPHVVLISTQSRLICLSTMANIQPQPSILSANLMNMTCPSERHFKAEATHDHHQRETTHASWKSILGSASVDCHTDLEPQDDERWLESAFQSTVSLHAEQVGLWSR
jgi:hypothetical protein